MATIGAELIPVNGAEVGRKLQSFLVEISSRRQIRKFVEPIVESEYARQFSTKGSHFGAPWVGVESGRLLGLVLSGSFRASFRPGRWRRRFTSGRFTFDMVIRNPHKPSGVTKQNPSLIELLREAGSISIEVTGPVGGISAAGGRKVSAAMVQHGRDSLRRAGFGVA